MTSDGQDATSNPRPESTQMTDPDSFANVTFDLSHKFLAPSAQASDRRLTPRQRERLTTVLRATLMQVDANGYGSFGMRDLAATGVATATIYRFFGSREFLVFRATSAWFDWAAKNSLPPDGYGDFRRSSIYQFDRMTAMWAAHPNLVDAVLRSAASDDPLIRRAQVPPRSALLETVGWAGTSEFTPEYADRLRSMIGIHAIGGMVQWVQGGQSLESLREDFHSLLSLVFDPPQYSAPPL